MAQSRKISPRYNSKDLFQTESNLLKNSTKKNDTLDNSDSASVTSEGGSRYINPAERAKFKNHEDEVTKFFEKLRIQDELEQEIIKLQEQAKIKLQEQERIKFNLIEFNRQTILFIIRYCR